MATNKEFYQSCTKEQLITFLLNEDNENEYLRDKILYLTGCAKFGEEDPMDGCCVECYYGFYKDEKRCHDWQEGFSKFHKRMREEREKIIKNREHISF